MSSNFSDLFQTFHTSTHSGKPRLISKPKSQKPKLKSDPLKSKLKKKKTGSSSVSSEKTGYAFVKIGRSKSESKKFDAVFQNRSTKKLKVVSFGSTKESDYLTTKDKAYRDWYNSTNKINEKNLMDAKTLNRYICWNKSNLKDSVDHYQRLFKIADRNK